MRYGKAIALVGLVVGLVGVAPIAVLPGVAQMTEQRKTEAERLLQQGIQQAQSNQYQLASQSFEQALNIYQQISDRTGEARVLIGLGTANIGLGNGAKAVELIQRAVAIAKEVRNPELEKLAQQFLETAQKQTEAKRLVDQGIQQIQSNQYQAASQSFEQALTICRQIKHRSGEGAALIGLGWANLGLGNSAKALELSQQAIAIGKELNNSEMEKLARQVLDAAKIADIPQKREADRVLQQGIQQIQNNQPQAAVQFFEQALTIYRQLKHRPGEGAVLIGLGEANLRLGNSAKALELSQQAIAIAKDLNNPEMEKLARQVLEVAQRAVGSSTQTSPQKVEADQLVQQGVQQLQNRQNQAAGQSFERALMIYSQIKYQPGVGAALLGLGEANLRLGNSVKALELSQQAISIAKEINSPAASGRGMKKDLLVSQRLTLQVQGFAPRGGEFTRPRLKNPKMEGLARQALDIARISVKQSNPNFSKKSRGRSFIAGGNSTISS